jgi:hypothetical protein
LHSISHANSNRNKPIKQAVCDRGYVGAKIVLGANIILPKKAASVAYRLFDGFVSVAIGMAYGNI